MNAPRIPDPRDIEVIDDATAAMFRAMTPAQRVIAACDAHTTARLMTTARVIKLHSDWPDDGIRSEVARRMIRGPA